jgi:hypothetical protein
MFRLAAFFAPVVWLLTGVSCRMEFINPPPFGTKGDFSQNPIYVEDSTVNIAWTEGEKELGASLVLYQLNETDGQWFGEMEYLTRTKPHIPTLRSRVILTIQIEGAVRVTRYSWLSAQEKTYRYPQCST